MFEKFGDTIKTIKPLYTIGNILAVVPPMDIQEDNLFNFRLYSGFVSLIILCGFGFVVQAKTSMPEEQETEAVLWIFNMTSQLVSMIFTILLSSVSNVRNFNQFLMKFNQIDKVFEDNIIRKWLNRPNIELLIIHILYLGGLIHITSITFAKDCKMETCGISYIFFAVSRYFRMVMVLLMYNFCRMLKTRYKNLNKQLKNILHSYVMDSLPLKIYVKPGELQRPNQIEGQSFDKIRQGRRAYSQLADLIKLYSKLFGWQVLFLFGHIAITLLSAINKLLTVPFHMLEHSVFLMVAFVDTVMGVIVAVTCDMTTKEAQRTATVCYNLLLDVRTGSANPQDRILKEELVLLAEQATHQCPYFSAAGFFPVDYTLLFGLLGTVTSYIIVLIQINK